MRKHLKFVVLVLLAGLILWWFGRGLNWAEVRQSVGQSDWRILALAVVLIAFTYLLRAYRWRALLAPLTPASIRELFAATTVGFGSVFLFGRAGEIVRPVVLPLRDRRVRPAASFVTIMIERICDTVTVVVFFAANLAWFPAPEGHAGEFAHVRQAGLVLLGLTAAGLVGLAIFKRKADAINGWVQLRLSRWKFIPERVTKGIISVLEQLAGALRIIADARELARITGWTLLLWGVITIADWLVLRAFGLPFGISQTLFVMGWALVGSLVPTPGGAAGAFHAATAAGLIFLGVAREQAAAVSIILHFVVFSPALIFAIYFVLRGDINIKRLRNLTSSEAVEHAVEDEPIESLSPVKSGPHTDSRRDELEVVTVNES